MFKSLPMAAAGCMMVSRRFLRDFQGIENLPPKGRPAIIAVNHSSLLDGLMICAEFSWRTRRPFHPLVTADGFENPLYGWILRCTKAVPIDRKDARNTELALRTLLGYLARGEQITIFPEGHLNNGQSMRLPRPGMALLALESGAPVYPCGLRGTADVYPPGGKLRWRKAVEIHLGTPLETREMSARYHSAPAAERKQIVNELSYKVMARIAELSGQRLHRRMVKG